jgi:hypothetical protein
VVAVAASKDASEQLVVVEAHVRGPLDMPGSASHGNGNECRARRQPDKRKPSFSLFEVHGAARSRLASIRPRYPGETRSPALPL